MRFVHPSGGGSRAAGEGEPHGLAVREAQPFLYENAGAGGYEGRFVDVGGRRLLSFASYDYVGLARCRAVSEGALAAIERHGVQFPFPRAFLESAYYAELRTLLERMTAAHAVIAPSTTLAHVGALPALLEPGDAVLLDAAAHPSLRLALAPLPDLERESLPPHDLARLEERLLLLSAEGRRVWYLLDGVDPLTGRLADLETLSGLLERFPAFHLYVDDAHATSWLGMHGRGHALGRLCDQRRAVVTLSLNKAFGAAGAAILFADARLAERVERSPGMLLSGAIPPPLLGAALASARLHLSSELESRKGRLLERIRWVVAEVTARAVRLADTTESPIFFVACGSHGRALRLLGSLREQGLYAGAVIPPLVGSQEAGVRFMVSVHHEREDIEHLVATLARDGDLLRTE